MNTSERREQVSTSTTTKTVSTEYGSFEIRDSRSPGSDLVFRALPIDPGTGQASINGPFTVNRKTYHGHIDVRRMSWGLLLHSYVGWNETLSDSAYQKLAAAFEPIAAELPELDHDSKLAMVTETVTERARRLVSFELDLLIKKAVNDSNEHFDADERTRLYRLALEALTDEATNRATAR